ncbi:unnamed protein product [Phytomonas sp. Hart1]|nr:unnamed protein product [Phytomonas sp. Hart1]|eukprot:CCW70621.1 unnamed protein product [Phytomonas sp. isolate Hart1]
MLVRSILRWSAFLSHLHREPCTIGPGATEENSKARFVPPQSSIGMEKAALTIPETEGRTVLEMRMNGLKAWLDEFGGGIASCGDSLPSIKMHTKTCGQEKVDIDLLDPLLTLPDTFRLPIQLEGAQEYSSPMPLNDNDDDFMVRINAALTSPEAISKQLNFRKVLLDFREIANTLQLPFFLACGTALGARREGYFIPYDEDVDVGVFFEDLLDLGAKSSQGGGPLSALSGSKKELNDISAVSLASKAILELIFLLSNDSKFIVIDVCGTVSKGLEVRFLHVPTSVRLDLNVYYPPLPDDNNLISALAGTFVWSATYYAEADLRKHRMYRFRYHPFHDDLEDTTFCFSSSTMVKNGFIAGSEAPMKLPPIRYLEEYYGEDWQVPKKFSYFEGLGGGFKNIIEE